MLQDMIEDLRDLYAAILTLAPPWEIAGVRFDRAIGEVHIELAYPEEAEHYCPECGVPCRRRDSRRRRWRHLDTCQYRTMVSAFVPRVQCPEHGVKQIRVPWAEPGSRFTLLFEIWVIEWLREASMLAVARQMDLSWDQVYGIQRRAVTRGLARRQKEVVGRIGVDETSFQKRHEYVTVVLDLEGGRVLYVADDRKRASLDGFYEGLEPWQVAGIEAVSMDMWQPYIQSTRAHVPEADGKICFDKFHVAKHLGDAVNKVRRQEHRVLCQDGDNTLKRSKHLWLRNPANMTRAQRRSLAELRQKSLQTARAWCLKEAAMGLWHYTHRGWATQAWKWWLGWAFRSRLEPMRQVARMVKSHLGGILNAVVMKVTNACCESVNAKIQWIKRMACGYRNRERFRMAIMFHCGGLDLHPRP